MTRVAIAGGGLAGLTCAKRLSDAGVDVVVIEGEPRLGGRAATWVDDDGDGVEQGLHVFLGIYSEFRALLRDIGVAEEGAVAWMPDVQLQSTDGDESVFGVNPVAAPFRTLRSVLLDHRYLSIKAKLGVAAVGAPALRSFDHLRRHHDGESVVDWWRARGAQPEVLERYLRPFCRGIQFTEPEDMSAFALLGLLHHVVRDVPNALLGGYRGPRDDRIFAPFGRALHAQGVSVQVGRKIVAIDADPSGVRHPALVCADGERVEADAVVAAVPLWAARRLLSLRLRALPFFAELARLPVAPAISVQLWLRGAVIDHPRFVLVSGTPACVYQDLAQTQFPDERGSRLSVIVSPADDLLDVDDSVIVDMVLHDLARAAPVLRTADVRKSLVLKHREHLLRPAPGALSARPSQRTPLEGLYLAGDWTDQPFFGSQEGAVRSGNRCAAVVLEDIRYGRSPVAVAQP